MIPNGLRARAGTRTAAVRAPGDPPTSEHDALVQRYAAAAALSPGAPGVDFAQRALDIMLAGCAVIALLPLLAAIGAAVRLLSGAPLLYRGRRVGRAGRVFTMYKFRTLTVDAETRLAPHLGPQLTALTTQEYTTVGRVLRSWKLDELPQLFNVLRGDMSLVGPRPIRPSFFEQLCLEIPQYWQRLVVRPGITGLAQLRLDREMTWAEKLAHDLEYIADRSVGLYATILLDTLRLLGTRRWRAPLARPVDAPASDDGRPEAHRGAGSDPGARAGSAGP